MKRLENGDSFGELALTEREPRKATIRCVTECHFCVLDRYSFNAILKRIEEQKILAGVNRLLQIPAFAQLSEGLLRSMHINSFYRKYRKGQNVYREQEEAREAFIVVSGEFEVTKKLENV
jgi:CRP-like cAMP-binding protein